MLIILDRDGVINEDSKEFIKTPDEMIFIPGSLQAIAALCQAGYPIVVATNQSGLGRGLYSEATLAAMHHKLETALAELGGKLSGIFYCPHLPDDNCTCRKPKPGLFLEIAEKFNLDLRTCLSVGDSARDILAAAAVDCPAVLVKTGNGLRTLAEHPDWGNVPVFEDLSAVADWVLENQQGS